MMTSSSFIALIYVNLGTPDAPTTTAVRDYLAEFLKDRRIVALPACLWYPLLYGIVLRKRPPQSALKYKKIWLQEKGSPLLYYTKEQARLMQAELNQQAPASFKVYVGMRYGKPSLMQVLSQAQQEGAQKIYVLPAYPQQSVTTTQSVVDVLKKWASEHSNTGLEIGMLMNWHVEPGYIRALADSVRQSWKKQGKSQLLLMSFHGVPLRALKNNDPYERHCYETAQALAFELGLKKEQWKVSFQSRFGAEKWLAPSTSETLDELAQKKASVDVICPGFTSDCLETLEEINDEAREAFLKKGGSSFTYIPCLNDSPVFVSTLARLAISRTFAAL